MSDLILALCEASLASSAIHALASDQELMLEIFEKFRDNPSSALAGFALGVIIMDDEARLQMIAGLTVEDHLFLISRAVSGVSDPALVLKWVEALDDEEFLLVLDHSLLFSKISNTQIMESLKARDPEQSWLYEAGRERRRQALSISLAEERMMLSGQRTDFTLGPSIEESIRWRYWSFLARHEEVDLTELFYSGVRDDSTLRKEVLLEMLQIYIQTKSPDLEPRLIRQIETIPAEDEFFLAILERVERLGENAIEMAALLRIEGTKDLEIWLEWRSPEELEHFMLDEFPKSVKEQAGRLLSAPSPEPVP